MYEMETALQLLAKEEPETLNPKVPSNSFFTGSPEERQIWHAASQTKWGMP